MLEVQLASLSMPELRRLLQAARTRGQAELVHRLEAELTGRAGGLANAPVSMAPATYAARHDVSPPPAVRSRKSVIAIAGLAASLGAALAWGVSLKIAQPPKPQPVASSNPAPPQRVAVALTVAADAEAAQTRQLEASVASDPASPEAGAPTHNPCYDLPTARERLVCGYPTLASQDRRMKAVLERARAGARGRDRDAIDEEQDAWQGVSAHISDRHVLGERYARRIADLEADVR
ncbi:MAG TPA: hypothetical protein VF474_05360 [Phenylobacterium sp.]